MDGNPLTEEMDAGLRAAYTHLARQNGLSVEGEVGHVAVDVDGRDTHAVLQADGREDELTYTATITVADTEQTVTDDQIDALLDRVAETLGVDFQLNSFSEGK